LWKENALNWERIFECEAIGPKIYSKAWECQNTVESHMIKQ